MREFIDQQIDQCGYSTASEYIRYLIRQDQEKAEKKQIENLIHSIGFLKDLAYSWSQFNESIIFSTALLYILRWR